MQMSQVFVAPEMASLSGWGEAPLVSPCNWIAKSLRRIPLYFASALSFGSASFLAACQQDRRGRSFIVLVKSL